MRRAMSRRVVAFVNLVSVERDATDVSKITMASQEMAANVRN